MALFAYKVCTIGYLMQALPVCSFALCTVVPGGMNG